MFYRGWIPTVNKRLSYRIIGETRYPEPATYSNVVSNEHRYAVVWQTRSLSDVLFPYVLSKLFGVSGDFHFFLVVRGHAGARSADAKLIGKLYAVRSLHLSWPLVESEFAEYLLQLREHEYEQNVSDPRSCRDIYCSVHDLLERVSDISANVVIRRSGMLSIHALRWHDEDLRRSSYDYASSHTGEFEHGIADQMYFFVRDISHHHQHHSPDTDTLITVHADATNDLAWARNIIYSLYYRIITRKRYLADEEQAQAQGILAYLMSFKSAVQDRAIELGVGPSIPSFNDESLRYSLEATKDYVALTTARRRVSIDVNRNVILGALVVILGMLTFMVSFADPSGAVSPTMRVAANFVREQAGWILPGLMILTSAYFGVGLFDALGRRAPFIRDAVRLALLNRRMALLILLIFGAACAGLALWLVNS